MDILNELHSVERLERELDDEFFSEERIKEELQDEFYSEERLERDIKALADETDKIIKELLNDT